MSTWRSVMGDAVTATVSVLHARHPGPNQHPFRKLKLLFLPDRPPLPAPRPPPHRLRPTDARPNARLSAN
jgi:hypothetical protein